VKISVSELFWQKQKVEGSRNNRNNRNNKNQEAEYETCRHETDNSIDFVSNGFDGIVRMRQTGK
jgi:hypothetical protein